MNRTVSFVLTLLLLVLFAGIGCYGLFFAPADEAVSERENRILAARPAFTSDGWLSGSYAEKLETYLLDRFVLRDSIVLSTQNLRSAVSLATYDDLMNYKLAALDDEAGVDPALLHEQACADPVPDAPVPPILASAPAPTAPPPEAGENEPAPAGNARAPLPAKQTCEIGDIAPVIGIYLETSSGRQKLRTFERSELPDIVRILNEYAKLLPEDGRLILAAIPVSYYGSRLLRTDGATGMVSTIDPAIEALTAENVRVIPATTILGDAAMAGDYVYFRTDNHCTPYGTYLWYSALVRAAGYEPTPLSAFTVTKEDPFLGTFYRDDPSNELRENADVLEKYLPPQPLEFRRYTAPDDYDILPIFWENANENDRYTVCLGGTGGAWNTLINLERTDGTNCLVVSDSFGPVAVTMLSGQYKEVHFIDPRYFKASVVGGSVADLMEKYSITDCFFLLSVNWIFGEDSYIKIAGRRLY